MMSEIVIGCGCSNETCYLGAKIDIERRKLIVAGMNHGDPKTPPVVINLSDDGLKKLREALGKEFVDEPISPKD